MRAELAIAVLVASVGCSGKRESVRASVGSGTGSSALAAAPSGKTLWPGDVPSLLANVPDEVDDVFVQRGAIVEGHAEQTIVALAILVFAKLPIPDDVVLASTTSQVHIMLWDDGDRDTDRGCVVSYDGLELGSALPRAIASSVSHSPETHKGGCVEDKDARIVRGLQVHGTSDSINGRICLPGNLVLKAAGEILERRIDAVANKKLGASPAAKILTAALSRIEKRTYMAAAWSRKVGAVTSGLVFVRDDGARAWVDLELTAPGAAAQVADEIRALHATLPPLTAFAPTVTGDVVTVSYELDKKLHEQLWAIVPDDISGADLIASRPAELRTLGSVGN